MTPDSETDEGDTQVEPVEIAELEEAEAAAANPELEAIGKRFFFGEVGVLKFEDNTHYHVKQHHVTLTDPKLIENVLKVAKNSSNKIFLKD